jgi:serine/threonine-protein phosphatase 2A regulatory subunit A
MDSGSNSVYSAAILIEDLRSDDKSRKLNAVPRLSTIAEALGPERTRNELIPFLQELLDEDEDILQELAKALRTLTKFVGGPRFVQCLFELLEKLYYVEEEIVRNAAVESTGLILDNCDIGAVADLLIDLVKRLAQQDWHCIRSVSAQLVPHILKFISLDKAQFILQQLQLLLKDPSTDVRKTAARSLSQLSFLLGRFEAIIVGILNDVARDSSDTVRLLAIDCLLEYSNSTNTVRLNGILGGIIKILGEDPAWRVRYLLTDKLVELSDKLGAEQKVLLIYQIFIKSLQDTESEVRTAACTKLAEVARIMSPEEVIRHILPNLATLGNDNLTVKGALACQITKLCPIVGRSATNEKILPVILELLKADNFEIKISIFKDLDSLQAVIGTESLVQSIFPTIREISENTNWRVRADLIQILPVLFKQLGKDFFSAHLIGILLKGLEDPIFSVREATTSAVSAISKEGDANWCESVLMSTLIELQTAGSYNKRLIPLATIRILFPLVTGESKSRLFSMLIGMASDNVPNVRLKVAKVAKEIAPFARDASLRDPLKTTLRVLNRDEDQDVRYYAETALRCF